MSTEERLAYLEALVELLLPRILSPVGLRQLEEQAAEAARRAAA